MRRALRTAAVCALLLTAACGASTPPAPFVATPPTPRAAPQASTPPPASAAPPAPDEPAVDPLDTTPPVSPSTYKDGYFIVLHRDRRKGERVRRTVTASQSRAETLVAAGNTLRRVDESLRVRLVADEEVLAVDRSGNLRGMKLTIVSFVASGPRGDQVLMAPGSDVSLIHAGADALRDDPEELKISSSRGPVGPAAKRALALAVPFDPPSGNEDDGTFGSDRRRQLGEKWALPPYALNEEARQAGLHVDQTVGQTQLVDISDGRGEPVLRITSRAAATIEGLDASPDATIERGSIQAEMGWLVPLAGHGPAPARLEVREIAYVARVPHGSGAKTLTVSRRTVRDTTFEPIPGAATAPQK